MTAVSEEARCPSVPDLEALDRLLTTANKEKRTLYEHEGYAAVQAVDLADVPKYRFVPRAGEITPQDLQDLEADRLVIKIVSPEIVHKTEAGGVVFVPNELEAVRSAIARIYESAGLVSSKLVGVLICACVDPPATSLGAELFVGLRMTREFGPVLTAGLGGTDTELLAVALKPPLASATASASLISADGFLELFKRTLGYTYVSGSARGKQRLVTDAELHRCFAGLLKLAERYCAGVSGRPSIIEFEINPLIASGDRLVALDAVCRFGERPTPRAPRPLAKIEKLLKPQSMAIVGVSGKAVNMGRIILRNVRKRGFDPTRLFVIKPGEETIDETPCVPGFGDLPGKVDLVVIAVGADQTPDCIREIIRHQATDAVIVIPGGMGETEGGAAIERSIKEEIAGAHLQPDGGPIFVGGNCLGVQSQPGKYDTFFIPPNKLEARLDQTPRKLAFVSQSGAFLITRLSNVGCLDPTYALTLGNQIDLTASDCLEFLADDPAIDTFAIYLEGLVDLDGMTLARATRRATQLGKTVIIYKAGRTAAGRTATQGHTSVIAGDYAVCAAILRNAGAIVTDDFRQFEQLVELSTTLHDKRIEGFGLGVVTNAGFESVGMADSISGPDHALHLPQLTDPLADKLRETLARFRLDTLVNPRNPLDLTPMANVEAYEQCARILLEDPQIHAVAVSLVPLTPAIKTTPPEIAHGITFAHRLAELHDQADKPLVAVIDSGAIYDALVAELRTRGLAVFRSADQAVRSLGVYLTHRRSVASPTRS